ncbi:hypothetical protein ACS5UA_12515 [Brucella sp. RRSP16]|uniref:hypothetical protein n=1 Tax=Brucella sp. RRSP16 TaxID=3453707 RepID=UPI003FCE70A4
MNIIKPHFDAAFCFCGCAMRGMEGENRPIVHSHWTIYPDRLFALLEQRHLCNSRVIAGISINLLFLFDFSNQFGSNSKNWAHKCVIKKTFS